MVLFAESGCFKYLFDFGLVGFAFVVCFMHELLCVFYFGDYLCLVWF